MKAINKRSIILLSVVFHLFTGVYAQTKSNPPQPNNGKAKFQVFFEKVYLHLDRQYYSSGEDVWFKAYLVNGQSNYLTATSGNLYVELISSESKLVNREVVHLNNGIGNGDFKLSDSIPEGKYRVRAYTKWMLNFGKNFIFEKEINIHSLKGIKPKVKEYAGDTSKIDINFFPEGGSLVMGVPSLVGFKATNILGKGCEVKGLVESSQGDTLGTFQSEHRGMGELSVMPVAGQKYFAVGTANNKPFKVELPAALPKGFTLRTVNLNDSILMVYISTNAETFNDNKGKQFILMGRSFGKTCFATKVLLNSPQLKIKVSKANFPAGITRLTFYDDQGRPNCERLAFIDKKNNVNLTFSTDKEVYKTRESITLKVKAVDQQAQPVKTNLSLAVTDANQVPQGIGNIVSYLMLESEIRGKIENAEEYFDPSNIKRQKQLDLLLLTQGWRDFVWKQIQDTTLKIKYMIEPGISISGRVRRKLIDTPVPQVHVTMKVMGAKANGLLGMTTDSLGRFFFEGIEFYGKKKLMLDAKNKKLENVGWVLMDSLFQEPIPITPMLVLRKDSLPGSGKFASEADSRSKVMKKYSLSDTIMLNEIMVSAKNKKDEQQLGAHMAEAGAGVDLDFKITPADYDYFDIGMYLQSKIPQAVLTVDDNTKQQRVAFRSMGRTIYPRFVLDGHSANYAEDVNDVYNLMMEDIDRILITKGDLMSSNSNNDGNNSERYVISISTKPGAREKKDFNIVNMMADGYYEARVFYAPKHNSYDADKPDLRTTIYWAPNIVTNESGEAMVEFTNADKPGKMRIITEGVSDKGVPVQQAGSYQVK